MRALKIPVACKLKDNQQKLIAKIEYRIYIYVYIYAYATQLWKL